MSDQRYYARIMSPRGIYPARTTVFDDAAFVADEELSFSVIRETVGTRGGDGEDDSYSEVQLLNPAEVRLYGSLQLSFDISESLLAFYPFWIGEPVEAPSGGLVDTKWLMDTVKPQLHASLAQKLDEDERRVPRYSWIEQMHLPPIMADAEYFLRDEAIDYGMAQQLHDNIDLSDHLYIRGLYAIIKSGMLRAHYAFMEEAVYMLFIALEVSFVLVKKKLQSQGVHEPTSKQAMDYIHDAFHDIDRVERYFEYYYDQRIASFHPESRLGVFPHAPLFVDDQIFLYRDMIEVFRFLICGYVDPVHKEKLKYQSESPAEPATSKPESKS